MRRLVRDKSICSSPGAEQGDVSIVESSTFDARTLLEAKCSSLGSPQSLPALVLGPLSLSRMHPELFADDSEFERSDSCATEAKQGHAVSVLNTCTSP
mmetsp:Transcript_7926/g.28942  ORF Transcript_7926/g.28942 Transcript_7926/m.28942 type:complete len:98 (+) Transcript_7926:381-674(+)